IETPPEEYDLMIEAERLSGTGALMVGIPVHGEAALIALDAGGTKSGFGGLRTPLYEQSVLPAKSPVCLVVYVRNGGVSVRAKGREILPIDEEKPLPAVPAKWRGEAPASWFLGSQDASFAIYGWSFVKVTSQPIPEVPETVASNTPSVPSLIPSTPQ